jgi:hypothetical protein
VLAFNPLKIALWICPGALYPTPVASPPGHMSSAVYVLVAASVVKGRNRGRFEWSGGGVHRE